MRMTIFLLWAACLAVTSPMLKVTRSAQVTSEARLTPHDLQNLGSFIADFSRSLHISIISLCVHQSLGVKEVYRRVASVLIRRLIVTIPCSSLSPAYRPCPQPSSVYGRTSLPTSTGRSCWNPKQATVHLTSRDYLNESVNQVVYWHRLTAGRMSQQMVLGQDLRPTTKVVVSSVAAWLIASYTKETKGVEIQEVYSFNDSDESVLQSIGSWQPTRGFSWSHRPGQGPLDFRGRTITLASFPYAPYVMLAKQCGQDAQASQGTEQSVQFNPYCLTQRHPRQLNEELYVGFLLDIFNILAQKLNFTYRVLLPNRKDYVFGMGVADNHSGLVGMIYRQEAQIALASLSISKDRLEDIDFSGYVDHFSRNLFVRSSASLRGIGRWGTYVQSFQMFTWLGMVGLLGTASLTLWFINRYEHCQVPQEIIPFCNILFMFFSCIVQQGVPTTPVTYRGRTVFWLFWFSCVILYTSYTARLTSSLTVSTKKLPFSTFNAAVDSFPKWQIGIMKGTPLVQFIKEAKGRSYELLSSHLENDPDVKVDTEEEGVAKVLSTNYAFLTETQFMSYMYKNNCSIKEINIKLFPAYGHLGYSKNLPFAGILNTELFRLVSGGVVDRLHKKWWGVTIPCEVRSHFTELDFTHTATAFLVLLIGIILSVFFVVLEKLSKAALTKRKSLCNLQVNNSRTYIINKQNLAGSSLALMGRVTSLGTHSRVNDTLAEAHVPN